MRHCLLLIFFILIAKAHARKNRARHGNEKSWYLKSVVALCVLEGLGVNHLRDAIEVSVNDASLAKANDSIEGTLQTEDVGQVLCYFLKSVNTICR